MAGWTRHGWPAGVSILLGTLVAVLINLITEGWSWPVGVGLMVSISGWVGLEMRQATLAATRAPEPNASDGPSLPHQRSTIPSARPQMLHSSVELGLNPGFRNEAERCGSPESLAS